jgi:hypothetical protein
MNAANSEDGGLDERRSGHRDADDARQAFGRHFGVIPGGAMADGVGCRLAGELERVVELCADGRELVELRLLSVLALARCEERTADPEEVAHGFDGKGLAPRHRTRERALLGWGVNRVW